MKCDFRFNDIQTIIAPMVNSGRLQREDFRPFICPYYFTVVVYAIQVRFGGLDTQAIEHFLEPLQEF